MQRGIDGTNPTLSNTHESSSQLHSGELNARAGTVQYSRGGIPPRLSSCRDIIQSIRSRKDFKSKRGEKVMSTSSELSIHARLRLHVD